MILRPTLAMAARYAHKTDMEWHGATFIHPLALIIFAVLAGWMFVARRQRAVLPFMILICCVPSAQRIVIGGADFTLLRLMVMVAIVRALMFSELGRIRWNRVDAVYGLWVVVSAVTYVLQRMEVSAAVYACGVALDCSGGYLVARLFIRTIDDVRAFARTAALMVLLVAPFFIFEMFTRRNLFSVMGGVPPITSIRDGRLRCQGAFSHPILAGVFWASLLPIFAGAFFAGLGRIWFAAAGIAGLLIVYASASSTPVLGVAAAVAFWAAWPLRSVMRYGFLAAPFLLTMLHFYMKHPVWHLVSRMSAVGGSTGYHRYVLIDGAIRHFNEWWLVGTPWTGHWSEHFQTWDITNQYILEAVRGGIWRLGTFLALIVLCSLAIAKAQRLAKTKADVFLLWGIGGSLCVHCVSFIGVSYFGQISYLWYFTLGLAGSLATIAAQSSSHREFSAATVDDPSRACLSRQPAVDR